MTDISISARTVFDILNPIAPAVEALVRAERVPDGAIPWLITAWKLGAASVAQTPDYKACFFDTLKMLHEALDTIEAIDSECQLPGQIKDLVDAALAHREGAAPNQEQCDEDGVMVKVSRQALDGVLNAINDLAIAAAHESIARQ
jgi:hypothetical protein